MREPPETAACVPPERSGSPAGWPFGRVQGLVSDLGNPKIAVFFASLLPQFVPAGSESFLALLALGVTFATMTFVWLTLYAALVAKAGDFLRRSGVRRAIEGITGTVMIGLGIRIAAEQR
jgi:threonine/homoserine/homoserine lactone efflux protein